MEVSADRPKSLPGPEPDAPNQAPATEPTVLLDDARPDPLVEPFKEVRLAVVMYGGVSLAIYINGVAQELMSLVRAAAPADRDAAGGSALLPNRELRGAEQVRNSHTRGPKSTPAPTPRSRAIWPA